MTKPQTSSPEVELTPEQTAEMRAEMLQFYSEQMTVLNAQLEYEKILADIEENRTRRMMSVIRQAQMAAGPSKEMKRDEEKQERKLKTEA